MAFSATSVEQVCDDAVAMEFTHLLCCLAYGEGTRKQTQLWIRQCVVEMNQNEVGGEVLRRNRNDVLDFNGTNRLPSGF